MLWLCLGATVIAVTNCAKKKDNAAPAESENDDEGGDDKGDDKGDGGGSGKASNLSVAFPGTLALSVFPESSGASLRLAGDEAESYNPAEQSIQDKVADAAAILDGSADSCMPKALGAEFNKDADELCYEFDQDMIYGSQNTSATTPIWRGTTDGTNSAGEACLVAFTRNQVAQVVAMVDQTLGFGMAAVCQAKKTDPEVQLPTKTGDSLDLKAALTKLFGNKLTVTEASVERLADAGDFPVYRMYMKVVLGADELTRTIGIIHSPHDDKNSEYNGTIYVSMNGDLGGGGNTNQPHNRVMSIVYSKTDSNIKAELRTANFDDELLDQAIDDSGVLNFNAGANFSGTEGDPNYGNYSDYAQANQALNAITYITFDLNPTTNEGSLSYWKNPGGNYYENARGFNIAITADDDGVLSGCATSGSASIDFTHGTSIRRYLKEGDDLTLQPKGFWHPFMNSPSSNGTDADGDYYNKTNGGQTVKWYKPLLANTAMAGDFASDSDGPLITRQCFTQNESGLYLIDTTKITESSGFEVLDTGNTANAAKFIAPPDIAEAQPFELEIKKEE